MKLIIDDTTNYPYYSVWKNKDCAVWYTGKGLEENTITVSFKKVLEIKKVLKDYKKIQSYLHRKLRKNKEKIDKLGCITINCQCGNSWKPTIKENKVTCVKCGEVYVK